MKYGKIRLMLNDCRWGILFMEDQVYDNLGLIVAMGKNREIGYNNELIWRIKEDLNYFKKVTMDSHIIMGRKTYDSMPKNLEGRKYVVLSRDLEFHLGSPKIVTRSISETLHLVQEMESEKFFVVGGEAIYKSFLPFVHVMHITEILESFKRADAYFPEYDKNAFLENVLDVSAKEEEVLYRRFVLTRKK